MAKRMEWVTKQSRLILPYGMLLTRLFKFDMNESLELSNESYVLYDRVMNPLTAQQARKIRKDRGTRRDVSPRPSNPQPLQSHPSLDITLSLSPITPLDHILDTPSPPSPQPPPQPPLMGHPIYFNYHDYHGSTCLYCFHNRNLIFSLRDEMDLMFAYIEYLLTSTMNSLSSPYL
ncbi:hypothetical protein Tco_0490848 [Tanacetum coccineum]